MLSRILFHPITAVIITLLVGAFWLSMVRSQLRFRQAQEPLEQLQREVAVMEGEVASLEDDLRVASSAAMKERIARNELLLKKPGEYVVYIENLELPTEASAAAEPVEPWQSWQAVWKGLR